MRAYIPDLTGFLSWLDLAGHKYVVLREPEIYREGFPAPGSKQDVDLLVDDTGQEAIEQKYGKGVKWEGVKCDIYSRSGLGKGANNGHPYFPSSLADRILENRVMYEDLFYVPAPQDHFDSLLYHIAYQKGEGSHVGFDDPKNLKSTKYYKALKNLSETVGVEIPSTLCDMHWYLKEIDCEVPLAWLRLDVMKKFESHRKSFFQAWLMDHLPGEFNFFVIRKTARKHGREAEIVKVLEKHYEVMKVLKLGFMDQKIKARKMRGNKWRNGGPPVLAVLLFDPEPGVTTEEDRKIHPFVFNDRQFFKRGYREHFLKSTSAHRKANPLHSTDNEAEAIGHLPMFFNKDEVAQILEDLDLRREKLEKETG
ncbi:hypothetical protein A9Q83_08335 [Alphaproteobacteria bacterium 46_93_T64]|nr:hypothetical protein A9Q83_08335 [Alphaproteobacteria bacterium 46_93_T64]